MANTPLKTQLRPVKRRCWLLGIATGSAWTLVVVVLLMLLGGWFDLVWELSPFSRIGVWGISVLIGILFFIAIIFQTGRAGRLASLAECVDRTMGFGGAVLTGCELEKTLKKSQRNHPATDNPATKVLACMAVEHAATLAKSIVPEKAVPARPAQRSAIVLLSLLGLIGGLTALKPDLMQTQWKRFFYPFSDVPQFSNTSIEIEDPEKKVVYGEPLDIRAAVRGEPVDSVFLVLEDARNGVETLPMFPEADSYWRAGLAKVTENAVYHVRADRARSTKHSIEVITVPRIEKVRFRIVPPTYTNRPAYVGALPKEGISGLAGTKVEIRATSNRPLSRGAVHINMRPANSSAQKVLSDSSETIAEMFPTSPGASEVVGTFIVSGNGRFDLRLFDVDGQDSRDKFSGGITLLQDQRPTIRILKPPPRSLATPSVVLPVEIDAEDDYGLSRVQLFRSLNDSRFLPTSFPLVDAVSVNVAPRRWNGQVDLPLASYGLKPGDSIKFFARAEDNDPEAAKGAESPVVLVEIISQEEFEQLLLAKNGMELMLSRYREALRRLEAVKDELETLQKKLEQQTKTDGADKDGPLSDENRLKLEKLAARMQKETEAIRKLARNPLPYDLDNELAKELEQAAQLTKNAGQSLEKMLESMRGDTPPGSKAAQKLLRELAETLGSGKQDFEQATMPQLELLAAVLPLKASESRFAMLVMRQKDLAERLNTLKGRDKVDDPTDRARMRELEEEQREIQQTLDALLNDIEEQAKMLPERPELELLRQDALKFVDDVRASAADATMSEARNALTEFSGTVGHAKAEEAAEILERFLGQCKGGMGQCISDALRFRPGLGNCMNQTLEQLLRNMGFGMGGNGSGMAGMGGGFGAQRGRGNVGLFGMMPGMTSFFEGQGGGHGGGNSRGKGGPGDGLEFDSPEGYETSAEGKVGGTGEATIPLRYRQAVGRYFQRILEESENND